MGDLGIMILLLPPIYRLQISFRKRAGTVGIFVGLAVIFQKDYTHRCLVSRLICADVQHASYPYAEARHYRHG
jgi:hypothetical protein